MKKKHFAIFAGLIALVTFILCLQPVSPVSENDCLVLKGTVLDVSESGVKDVAFKLRGHNEQFYVNRGMQRGLNLKNLRADLMGREIVLKYPDHWTPLDPNNMSIHISKIEYAGKTIFSELD